MYKLRSLQNEALIFYFLIGALNWSVRESVTVTVMCAPSVRFISFECNVKLDLGVSVEFQNGSITFVSLNFSRITNKTYSLYFLLSGSVPEFQGASAIEFHKKRPLMKSTIRIYKYNCQFMLTLSIDFFSEIRCSNLARIILNLSFFVILLCSYLNFEF